MKLTISTVVLLFLCICLNGQNTALTFDGATENLVVDHKPTFDVKDSGFTIEAWIFANSWTTEIWRGSIFANDNQGPDRGYAFRCGNDGSLSFVMAVDNAWNDVETTPIMNARQWHHVAVTVGNGTMALYIDGQAISSAPYDGSTISTNPSNDITIGRSAGFNGRNFDGLIDEIRIWNVTRTPSEIADNTTTNFTGNEAGLVAYFPMDEGSGTTVTNLVDASCSAIGIGIDDNNWQEGYSLPEFDLSVRAISGIDRLNVKTRPVKVSVDIQNVGRNTLNNYDLTLFVDGEPVVTETASLPLLAGELGTYTFVTPIDLSELSEIDLSVELSHPNDANILNNTSGAAIVNKTGNVVNVFDREVHNFGNAGQTHSTSFILPGDLANYSQILLHISLDCPSGGCDPWDQTANVSLNTDQGPLEIARYITPYGIACGPWTIDVTDFSSVLTGNNELTSFVSVFGQSGWAVTMDLEFVEDDAPFPHSRLTSLWSDDYIIYGDPGISHDLAESTVSTAANTEQNHVRIQLTGHGQGNTSNAAEFFNVTHQLLVDGDLVDNHHLWKNDCAANPCTNQLGNYLFSRAGWCPGQEVIPAIFNTTQVVPAASSRSFDYVFQDYTNLLNTGYNNSGHTEPHYRLHGYFVENSSTRYVTYTNLIADEIVVDHSSGIVNAINLSFTNNGSETLSNPTVAYYIDGALTVTEMADVDLLPGESHTHSFVELVDLIAGGGQFDVYGEVLVSDDETPGDNITATLIDFGSATLDLNLLEDIAVYPNPSDGHIQIEVSDKLLGGQIEITTIEGRMIQKHQIAESKTIINNLNQGTLILKVIDVHGNFASKRIVVID